MAEINIKMDRKSSLSNSVLDLSFDEDIKKKYFIYYLASQRDKPEWSLDNPLESSLRSILPLIRRTPTMSAVRQWIYPETQSIQGSLYGSDYPSLDNALKKPIDSPQIFKASLSERGTMLQALRSLSGKKTVLDKLRSRLDKLKTDISSEKHQLLEKKYAKRR